MKKIETTLKDCYILEPDRFDDERGCFKKIEVKDLKELGFKEIIQVNESESQKGVLRGLHFQTNPYSQAKLVRCTTGKLLDVVVDLRSFSESYAKWISVMLTKENGKMLFIPRGFAHGFISLTDETIFEYYIDNYYMKANEAGIIWNDADLNIDWQLEENKIDNLIISEKDKKHLSLRMSPDYFKEVL